jgi:hypothetical protein
MQHTTGMPIKLLAPAGTIWRGNEVIEGVLDALQLLRQLVRVQHEFFDC